METLNKKQKSRNPDIHSIFNRIAPYLEKPEFIMDFLNRNSGLSQNELKELVEEEIKNGDPITNTDLRILLNSL